MRTSICPECGAKFETDMCQKIYCSDKCRSAKNYRTKKASYIPKVKKLFKKTCMSC